MPNSNDHQYECSNGLFIHPAHRNAMRDAGLDSLAALLSIPGEKDLNKPGLPTWRQRLRLERTTTAGPITIFLKRFRQPPWAEQCRRLLTAWPKHGTAWLEWHWLHRLSALGINVAKPIAFGESMQRFRERASVVVVQQVPGQSLERWAARTVARLSREWIVELANLIARLHRSGHYHRDLYLAHIFVDESAGPGQRFHLIDLQRVVHSRWRRFRWTIKDLAALNYSTPSSAASNTDRIRFLRRYLGIRRLRPSDRRLIHNVITRTHRMARHDRKHGRVTFYTPVQAQSASS